MTGGGKNMEFRKTAGPRAQPIPNPKLRLRSPLDG